MIVNLLFNVHDPMFLYGNIALQIHHEDIWLAETPLKTHLKNHEDYHS